MAPLAVLGLGFVLGVRHATDVDHVAAVTTMTDRERPLRRAVSVATLWGVGHTLALLAVGGAMVVFGVVIPERLGLWLELLVAAMLVTLGVMNFSATRHVHAAARPVPLARPLVVGCVHGLAGSAAVALLVLATIREPVWALVYLVIFGLGTLLGMALLTVTIAMPLAAASRRFDLVERSVVRALGVLSVAVGVALAYRVGFVDGLFLAEALAAK